VSRLSVVIIAQNEASNIRRCLESVRWADEIIVVDSGSTDDTPRICQEFGCEVIHRAWQGYADQKNFALEHATGDWVLSLDADEEVTPELADEIKEAVRNARADAYSMPRRNNFLGRWMRHGGWYPDRQVRLFRRGIGKFKPVPLHENIILPECARLGLLSAELRHYTYPRAADFIKKADVYASIEAQTLVREGRTSRSPICPLVFAIPLKFAEVYIWKGGWRDGLHGFVAAVLMSVRVFLRWVKVWELQRADGDVQGEAQGEQD